MQLGRVTSALLLCTAHASDYVAPQSQEAAVASIGVGFTPTAEDLACFGGFAAINFNITDFSRYSEFFNENSIMELPPAGQYQGVDNIIEYVKFLRPEGGVVAERDLTVVQDGYSGIDSEGRCLFTQQFVAHTTATALGNGVVFDQTALVKIVWDPNTTMIPLIYVGYTPSSLIEFFTLYNTNATAEFMCSTLENSCNSVFTSNGFMSQAECLSAYFDLPSFSGNSMPPYHFDGLDRACRLLHTSFAATNPTHCPHISFTSMQDNTGDVKCQTTDNNPVEGPFTATEWSAFEAFNVAQGLPTGFAMSSPSPTPAPTFMGAGARAHVAMAAAMVAVLAVWTGLA